MKRFICTKHGEIAKSERLAWGGSKAPDDAVRFCMHCYNEMISRLIKEHLGNELIVIDNEKKEL